MIYPGFIKYYLDGSPFSKPLAGKNHFSVAIFDKHLAVIKTKAGRPFLGFSQIKNGVNLARVDANAIVNNIKSDPPAL